MMQSSQPVVIVVPPSPQRGVGFTIVIAIVGFASIAATGYSFFSAITSSSSTSSPTETISIRLEWIKLWGILAALATVEVVIWLLMLEKSAASMVRTSIIMSLVSLGLSAVVNFAFLDIIGGIILCVVLLAKSIWFGCMAGHIEFAAGMLEASIRCLHAFPQLIFVWAGGLFAIAVTCCLLMIAMRSAGDVESHALLVQLGVLVFFGWMLETIKNIVFVIVSVVVGKWYTTGEETAKREGAVGAGFALVWKSRIWTIFYGSLVMLLLKIPKYCLRKARGSSSIIFKACCICCLTACANFLDLYNTYAFAFVAIHNVPWRDACKESVLLVRKASLEAVLFDSVLDDVISLGPFICAISLAAISALFSSHFVTGFVNWVAAVALGLATGYGFMLVAVATIDAALAAFFLSIALAPEELRRRHPELHARLMSLCDRRGLPSPDWLAYEL